MNVISDNGSNLGPSASEAATKPTERRRLTDTSEHYNTRCVHLILIWTKI